MGLVEIKFKVNEPANIKVYIFIFKFLLNFKIVKFPVKLDSSSVLAFFENLNWAKEMLTGNKYRQKLVRNLIVTHWP